MAQRSSVAMLLMHGDTPRDLDARQALRAVLADAAVSEPDDLGVFEIVLEADDKEKALERIWDAIAASGTDDHILFLEHPDLPEHWRNRSASPGR
jgi:hypothetical protein